MASAACADQDEGDLAAIDLVQQTTPCFAEANAALAAVEKAVRLVAKSEELKRKALQCSVDAARKGEADAKEALQSLQELSENTRAHESQSRASLAEEIEQLKSDIASERRQTKLVESKLEKERDEVIRLSEKVRRLALRSHKQQRTIKWWQCQMQGLGQWGQSPSPDVSPERERGKSPGAEAQDATAEEVDVPTLTANPEKPLACPSRKGATREASSRSSRRADCDRSGEDSREVSDVSRHVKRAANNDGDAHVEGRDGNRTEKDDGNTVHSEAGPDNKQTRSARTSACETNTNLKRGDESLTGSDQGEETTRAQGAEEKESGCSKLKDRPVTDLDSMTTAARNLEEDQDRKVGRRVKDKHRKSVSDTGGHADSSMERDDKDEVSTSPLKRRSHTRKPRRKDSDVSVDGRADHGTDGDCCVRSETNPGSRSSSVANSTHGSPKPLDETKWRVSGERSTNDAERRSVSWSSEQKQKNKEKLEKAEDGQGLPERRLSLKEGESGSGRPKDQSPIPSRFARTVASIDHSRDMSRDSGGSDDMSIAPSREASRERLVSERSRSSSGERSDKTRQGTSDDDRKGKRSPMSTLRTRRLSRDESRKKSRESSMEQSRGQSEAQGKKTGKSRSRARSRDGSSESGKRSRQRSKGGSKKRSKDQSRDQRRGRSVQHGRGQSKDLSRTRSKDPSVERIKERGRQISKELSKGRSRDHSNARSVKRKGRSGNGSSDRSRDRSKCRSKEKSRDRSKRSTSDQSRERSQERRRNRSRKKSCDEIRRDTSKSQSRDHTRAGEKEKKRSRSKSKNRSKSKSRSKDSLGRNRRLSRSSSPESSRPRSRRRPRRQSSSSSRVHSRKLARNRRAESRSRSRSRSRGRRSRSRNGKGQGKSGKGRKVCIPYLMGVCKQGDSCFFTHLPRDEGKDLLEVLRKTSCRMGVSCGRRDCIFRHPPGRKLPEWKP
eukprot:TRINITY_DN55507_c0_g1_i1.p1 TRINITY_DN55507_c0_g1~~TRINITY_DN55507_c0_g1_i1.p1  ORF type:complete len:952 (+),score=117.52 TRINITY_DN55507_c0_g1_i1:148-3003(+)